MPIEFEKDDEHNYHVEFVAAASSLRGRNYGIPATDKLQVCSFVARRVFQCIHPMYLLLCMWDLCRRQQVPTLNQYIYYSENC